jgi:hypothetical protein
MVKGILDINKRCFDAAEIALNRKAESVVSMSKEAKGWKAVVEVLERKAVPDTQDLLGRYELTLSEDGELLGYKQVLVRRRQDRLGIEFGEAKE